MVKLKGKLFSGNVFSMTLKQFEKSKKFGEGVMKPTALRTVKKGKKVYSQYYYKPFTYEEGL